MATKKKAAPKRKTANKSTARKLASVAESAEIVQPPAELVAITPANRKRKDYREMDVIAQTPAVSVVGGKPRRPGDIFRIGVIGSGPLPPSVRAA